MDAVSESFVRNRSNPCCRRRKVIQDRNLRFCPGRFLLANSAAFLSELSGKELLPPPGKILLSSLELPSALPSSRSPATSKREECPAIAAQEFSSQTRSLSSTEYKNSATEQIALQSVPTTSHADKQPPRKPEIPQF